MDVETTFKVQELQARYMQALDDDRLEDWPDFFADKCRYLVTTAENLSQGLPLGMIYATSRAMLRDRVRSLRQANVYEAQRYRHMIGPPVIEPGEGGRHPRADQFYGGTHDAFRRNADVCDRSL